MDPEEQERLRQQQALLGQEQAQPEQGINATDVMLGGAGLGGAAFAAQTGRAPAPQMTPKPSAFAQQVAANDAARAARFQPPATTSGGVPSTASGGVPATRVTGGPPATSVPTGTTGTTGTAGRIPPTRTGPVMDAKLIKPGATRALLGRAGLLGATAVGSYTASQALDEKLGLSDKIANFLTGGLYNRGMAGERGLTEQERALIAEGINPATGTRVGPFEEVITQEDRFDPIRSVATLNDEIRLERESGAQEQITPQQLTEVESYLANEGQPQIFPGFNAMSVEDTRAKLLEEFGAPTISQIQAQDEARRLAQQDPAFQAASAAREARIASRPDFMEAVSDADRRAQATVGGAASMSDADRRKLAKGLSKGASASEREDALKVQQQYGLGEFKPRLTPEQEETARLRNEELKLRIDRLKKGNPGVFAKAKSRVDEYIAGTGIEMTPEQYNEAIARSMGLGGVGGSDFDPSLFGLVTGNQTQENQEPTSEQIIDKVMSAPSNAGVTRQQVIDALIEKGTLPSGYTDAPEVMATI